MALDVTWTIEIGTEAAPVDFTDRCTGISIDQPLGFMEHAPHRCVITLNNFDGALTPGAGGTYSSTDWFAQGVFVSATVNGTETAEVFHGILNDFDIVDDGITSTVTLTAADWMTIGARAVYLLDATISGTTAWTTRVAASINAACTSLGFISLPYLGNDFGAPMFYFGGGVTDPARTGEIAAGSVVLGTKRVVNETLLDLLKTREQAGIPSVVWPTIIGDQTVSGDVYTKYFHQLVGDTLTRNADLRYFVFTEDTPGTDELPLGTLDRGYNVERIVNGARITSTFTTNTAFEFDQAAMNESGAKLVVATQSSMSVDADVERMATNLVNRFSSSEFGPRRITLDSAQWADTTSASDEALAELLDVRYGLWQPAVIEYTPTGASSQESDVMVIFGRRITATPSLTTITLELLPAVDYQSFVLDSSSLGVLDQNRLG